MRRRREARRLYIPVPERGKRYEPNGKRECARRRKQIAEGRLTQANGLDVPTDILAPVTDWPNVETDPQAWKDWADAAK